MLFLLLTVLAGAATYGWLKYRTAMNALTVFNGVWFIAVSAYQLRWSDIQLPLSNNGLILLTAALLTFNVGYFYVNIFTAGRYDAALNLRYKVKINRSLLLTFFYGWLLVEGIEVIYSGGIPLYWTFSGSGKTYFDFGIPSVHGFANSLLLVLLLLAYAYLVVHNSKDKHVRAIFLFLFVFPILLLTRQVIISGVLEVACLRVLLGKPLKAKHVLLVFLGIVLGFGVLGGIRTGTESFYAVAVIQNRLPGYLVGFHWLYMYLTMTIANVDYMANISFPWLNGLASASAFVPSALRSVFFSHAVYDVDAYIVSPAFNVAGYFREIYVDFGLTGVVIFSFFLGALGSLLWNRLGRRRNPKMFFYVSVYMQVIALSFFYNHLLYLPSGFQFVLFWALSRVIPILTFKKEGVMQDEPAALRARFAASRQQPGRFHHHPLQE